jgi:uncharacterized protein (TIGR02284 family)
MLSTDPTLDALNSLLRGELAATQTYEKALDKIDAEGVRAVLRRIRVEHRQAVQSLEEHIRYLGGEPTTTSGSWGTFADLVEGTARLFGVTPALRALREGEVQGAEDYERALEGEALSPDCRGLVRTALLPQTRAHVVSLDSLLRP